MSEDRANEAEWVDKARQVARAVLRSRHLGMTDAEFEKSWSISPIEWRWQYLAGVRAGFQAAGLHKAKAHDGAGMVMEWRTIDSAPRDGTQVLAYGPCRDIYRDTSSPQHYMDVTRVYKGRWTITWMQGHGEPTHWMPLPEPPK